MLFGDAKSKIRQWNTYYHALPAEIMGESVTIQPKKQKWSEAKRQKKKKKNTSVSIWYGKHKEERFDDG